MIEGSGRPRILRARPHDSSAVDEAEAYVIPLQVRNHLTTFVSKWQGEPIEPGKNWTDYETKGFDEPEKSIAQFIPEDHLILGTLS